MFEGIGKYILALIIIYFISYIVKKIEMSKMFKKANHKPSKAFIPFTGTKELINISHADPKLFKKTLIPFVRIPAFIKIYKEMVKTFGGNPDDAIYYYLFPMVYFTKLGSGNARVEIHDYDINNEYLENQNILYEPVIGETEKPLYEMTDPGYYVEPENKEHFVYKVSRKNNTSQTMTIKANDPTPVQSFSQVPEPKEQIFDINTIARPENNGIKENPAFINSVVQENIPNMEQADSIFTNKSLQPDERKEKIVEVEKKEEIIKNPIQENITGRPKMCPKCGAKLAPSATACFLCGNKL